MDRQIAQGQITSLYNELSIQKFTSLQHYSIQKEIHVGKLAFLALCRNNSQWGRKEIF